MISCGVLNKMEYERVRFDGQTVYLRDTHEIVFMGRDCLRGAEIDRQGEYITTRNGVFTDHVIQLENITRRTEMVYNNRYGELEAI